jgi:hypothetical protein
MELPIGGVTTHFGSDDPLRDNGLLAYGAVTANPLQMRFPVITVQEGAGCRWMQCTVERLLQISLSVCRHEVLWYGVI